MATRLPMPVTNRMRTRALGLETAKTCKPTISKKTKKGISLSGLLNAIDGVASHEGRVLVMTTNHPEKLDDALIRPGLVDMKIGFTLASQEQIKELFIRIYSPDTEECCKPSSSGTSIRNIEGKANLQSRRPIACTAEDTGKLNTRAELRPRNRHQTTHPNNDDFPSFKTAFGFSSAEIQRFLLTQKKDPIRALNEAKSWIEEVLSSKKSTAAKEDVPTATSIQVPVEETGESEKYNSHEKKSNANSGHEGGVSILETE
ncbi:hypothetical protein VTN00DRAFT_6443 [Thermoascus crustaceus]|uniref:uncharacterized protein n=1 Tax=Thermoascus crustaceus TaxID=5088 RepID=UPI0037420B3A